jgi:hypothetical protein
MKNKMNVIQLIERAEKQYLKRMGKHDWFDPASQPFSPAVPYYKRLGVFKASNVEFNPDTLEATSYNWWYFVKRIGGKLVFNNYIYSNTTSRHQSRVKSLLAQLGIKIDFEIAAPKGLQDVKSAIYHYEYQISALESAIANPKSRKAKNMERQEQIRLLQKQLELARRLAEYQEIDYERRVA